MSATKPKHADQWLQIYNPHPLHAQYWWVAVHARIRNNVTGEVRDDYSSQILKADEEHPGTFIWTDGNYACDCNRHLFFSKDEEDDEQGCGEGKYSVNLLNPVDGQVFYREFEE